MKKKLLSVLLVCFGIAVSAAESMWMTDFAAARKKAMESGKNMRLFTRICGRNPVPGVRQAGDISTLLQF